MGYADVHYGVEDSVSVFGALVLLMVWFLVACGAVLVAAGRLTWVGGVWVYRRWSDAVADRSER